MDQVVDYFTFSGREFPTVFWVGVMWITPALGAFLEAAPAVLMVLVSGGLEGVTLVTLFLLPMQYFKGDVLVPKIIGSFAGEHPLLAIFATLRCTSLFERRQKVPGLDVIVEEALEVAAFSKKLAGLRGCAGREG